MLDNSYNCDLTQLMNKFDKQKLVLRQLLIGAEMYNALIAMEFADKYHNGTRKDGVTPEFAHQIEIAMYAWSLPSLRHREATIATIFLHDIREDYGIAKTEIEGLFGDNPQFAKLVGDAVWAMTKKFRGHVRDTTEVFAGLAADEIASIAKGCDRIHNIQSMGGVFSKEKQQKYIDEVRELFLTMLKKARRNFPYQVIAYENIKFVLRSQISLIEATLQA